MSQNLAVYWSYFVLSPVSDLSLSPLSRLTDRITKQMPHCQVVKIQIGSNEYLSYIKPLLMLRKKKKNAHSLLTEKNSFSESLFFMI